MADAMAATGLVLTAAQTLFAALQCKELKEMCFVFGYKSKLEELESTFSTIKAVLLDAESKHQELSHEGHVWVEKLKDAVYNADDLLDEFTTMARLWKKKQGGNFLTKVLHFFSERPKEILAVFDISQDIKNVREMLDSIARDHSQFRLGEVYAPIKRKAETYSYVFEDNIIGRGADKKAVISLLLQDSDSDCSHHVQGNVSFVTIVGIGGLGKTVLSQLVYNDDTVKDTFEVKFWVCVSEEFGMKEILGKMFKSDMQQRGGDLDELCRQVLKEIQGKKYLLVLDDVWEERHDEWMKLRDFLIRGARGSRVLVTSRSKEVARAVGSNHVYELQGLSNKDSWELFKKVAFEPGKKEGEDVKFVDIGEKVVKKCANVPLSIRVIGSFLYGRDVRIWRSFECGDLLKMVRSTDDRIMSILKLSYYHLSPELKSCFSYCALFPKDWVIQKEVLMDLWLTQSCLGEGDDDQSMEDIGEECFSMLLQRCFFQDVVRNEYGEISSCKMHDLIHDLAQEVAGKESLVMLDFDARHHLDHKIRHLSISESCFLSNNCLDDVKTIRTFLQIKKPYFKVQNKNVGALLSSLKRVRVLDLSSFSMSCLHEDLGKLLHLRQLNFSECDDIQILPSSITKLHNLLVLKLRDCKSLRELPEDLRELIHLRQLDTYGCNNLTHMPAGMDSLTCLHKLSMFVVGGESSWHFGDISSLWRLYKVHKGQLRDLKALSNLRGELKIVIKDCSSYDGASFNDGRYLTGITHLKALLIVWEPLFFKSDNLQVVHETMLEVLQPYFGIERISLDGYEGVELPCWAASLSTALPCLVKISLVNCTGLQHLPSLSQLSHLKILQLHMLIEVEYMEDNRGGALKSAFFPSLEELKLISMYRLKGWWRDIGCEEADIPYFPRLHKLTISYCGSMTSFPGCPLLKTLSVQRCNKRWSIYNSSSGARRELSLEKLEIEDAGLMSSLFVKSVRGVASLIISSSEEERLIAAEEGFQLQASSLVDLQIQLCRNLKSMKGGGIEYLTNLRSLDIWGCYEMEMEDEEDGMPWKSLHSLSSLSLSNIPKVEILPRGFQYMTSLETLSVIQLMKLRAIPEWISNLTSLRLLSITDCPQLSSLPEAMRELTSLAILKLSDNDGLIERCQPPDGEDFHKIRHIPDLQLSYI